MWGQVQLFGLFSWAEMMWFLTSRKFILTCRLFLGPHIGHAFGPSFKKVNDKPSRMLETASTEIFAKHGWLSSNNRLSLVHEFISLFCLLFESLLFAAGSWTCNKGWLSAQLMWRPEYKFLFLKNIVRINGLRRFTY